MSYYNQRVLFAYSEYTICPYVTIEYDPYLTQEELDDKVREAALEMQHDQWLAQVEVIPDYPYHRETKDTVYIYGEPKITEDRPNEVFWQKI